MRQRKNRGIRGDRPSGIFHAAYKRCGKRGNPARGYGKEPFLITSSVIAILARRLVRIICDNCKEEYHPDEESLRNIGLSLEELSGKKLCRGKGCPVCLNTGYKGRTGIFEFLLFDDSIQGLILKTSDANAIKLKAVEKGMLTLRQDGAQKVLDGITTIEEVFRVTHQ